MRDYKLIFSNENLQRLTRDKMQNPSGHQALVVAVILHYNKSTDVATSLRQPLNGNYCFPHKCCGCRCFNFSRLLKLRSPRKYFILEVCNHLYSGYNVLRVCWRSCWKAKPHSSTAYCSAVLRSERSNQCWQHCRIMSVKLSSWNMVDAAVEALFPLA